MNDECEHVKLYWIPEEQTWIWKVRCEKLAAMIEPRYRYYCGYNEPVEITAESRILAVWPEYKK